MFDQLPILSREEAFDILSRPIYELKLSSDYYKAVFHLQRYPGNDTEEALISLLESDLYSQPLILAKRKAIEILAYFNCKRAIPLIGTYLRSDDPYLVENAASALNSLKCKDSNFHNIIASLLDDSIQNRRVLIQSLAGMGVDSYLDKINSFIDKKSYTSDIYGAAIAAVIKLSGSKNHLDNLKMLLTSRNQTERQTAVQDIIDSGAIELLPDVLQTPISPFFRIRAINILWPIGIEDFNELNVFNLIDNVITDSPGSINTIDNYSDEKSIEFLINEFFNTDFNRSYISLRKLSSKEPCIIWEVLSNYLERFKRDYGALYFLINLFNIITDWDEEMLEQISEIFYFATSDVWPNYMKFRPLAISGFIRLNQSNCQDQIDNWIDKSLTPYWVCRYSVLMQIERNLIKNQPENYKKRIEYLSKDQHPFVSSKAKNILNNNRF